jgi:hypothetical protein
MLFGGFFCIISAIAEALFAQGEINVDRLVAFFFQVLILGWQTVISALKTKH